MQAIVNDLNGFSSACDVLVEVKDHILHLVEQDAPALSHADILAALRQDITPINLYSRDSLKGTHTIHRILRNLLSLLGEPYVQHESTNRIAWGLVTQLFNSDDDQAECYSLLRSSQSSRSSETSHGNISSTGDAAKVTQAISSKFRNEKDKFEGRLEDSYDDVLATYSELCRDLGISTDMKFKYMHNLFTGEALRFYRDNVADSAVDFDQANNMMKYEYNSITRQNRCRAQLQKLRLANIMRKEKVDTVGALEYIRDTITKLAGQGPLEYRLEAHKREYLQEAVIGNPWATQCLATSKIEAWSFQKLYTALDAAYLHHEQTETAKKRDGRRNDQQDFLSSKPIGTYYEGQGLYGRPRKPGSRSSAPYQPKPFVRGTKQQRLCFNCGEPGHFIRECKKPQNIALTVANMVNKKGSNTKAILYELSCQSQDAIFPNQHEQAYDTMFGERCDEGDQNESDNDDTDENDGKDGNDCEEENEDVYYDTLSPEDF